MQFPLQMRTNKLILHFPLRKLKGLSITKSQVKSQSAFVIRLFSVYFLSSCRKCRKPWGCVQMSLLGRKSLINLFKRTSWIQIGYSFIISFDIWTQLHHGLPSVLLGCFFSVAHVIYVECPQEFNLFRVVFECNLDYDNPSNSCRVRIMRTKTAHFNDAMHTSEVVT